MKNNFTTLPSRQTVLPSLRRSAKQRQELIEQWRQSGKSKKAFCRERNLNYLTFISWGGKRSSLSAGQAGTSITGFIPIHIRNTAELPFAEVTYTNGCSITLHQSVPAEYLRNLLE